MFGAVRHEDGGGGARQIGHARWPQPGEEIVPEFGERGRRHRRAETGRKVRMILAAGDGFAVCVEEDDFQAASRADDDAVFEYARLLKRPCGETTREGGKEERQGNEAEEKARGKRRRCAPAAQRIFSSYVLLPIGQRPAPFSAQYREREWTCQKRGAGFAVARCRSLSPSGGAPRASARAAARPRTRGSSRSRRCCARRDAEAG